MIIYLANLTGIGPENIPGDKLSKRGKARFERLRVNAPHKAVQTAVADLIATFAAGRAGVKSELAEDENGRPFFPDTDLNVSISHCKDIVVVSVSVNKHGTDVELLRSVDEKTVRGVLSPMQFLDYLKADEPEKIKMFTRIFTEKESYVKYKGTGFVCKPSAVIPQNVNFLTKYMVRDSDVYCLTVCVEKTEKFIFEVVSASDLL